MLWNVITEPNGKNLSVDERARYIYSAPKGVSYYYTPKSGTWTP